MTTIGLIGSGNIGSTVAKLAVDAGYDVVVSNSRGPETLAGLVAELGPKARAATAAEAAEAADIAVVTIPLKNYLDLPAAPLAGKVVLDTINYYPDRDGAFADLDAKQTTSSQLVQNHLVDSQVVKCFNNIFFRHLASMARPAGAADRNTLIIAGDGAGAKQTATEFLDSIGYDAYDAGSLADSWRFERDMPAYAGLYAPTGSFDDPPQPADVDRIETLLAEGTR